MMIPAVAAVMDTVRGIIDAVHNAFEHFTAVHAGGFVEMVATSRISEPINALYGALLPIAISQTIEITGIIRNQPSARVF